jgi:DNA/RNA endonuclease YhcR with UshA esterase domain
MKLRTIMATLLLVPALAIADDSPKPITPAEAATKVKMKVTVQMLVNSTGGRENCYLNSEDDFTKESNFTIFLSKEAKEKFKKGGIDDPATYYQGKTIQVTGTVIVFEKKPRIPVTEMNQIKVIETKK